MAELRLGTRVGAETAHGLKLQLIHALVECLSAGSSDEATPASRRQGNCGPLRGFVAADYRFEALPASAISPPSGSRNGTPRYCWIISPITRSDGETAKSEPVRRCNCWILFELGEDRYQRGI
jgi:hypothetical protein